MDWYRRPTEIIEHAAPPSRGYEASRRERVVGDLIGFVAFAAGSVAVLLLLVGATLLYQANVDLRLIDSGNAEAIEACMVTSMDCNPTFWRQKFLGGFMVLSSGGGVAALSLRLARR